MIKELSLLYVVLILHLPPHLALAQKSASVPLIVSARGMMDTLSSSPKSGDGQLFEVIAQVRTEPEGVETVASAEDDSDSDSGTETSSGDDNTDADTDSDSNDDADRGDSSLTPAEQ